MKKHFGNFGWYAAFKICKVNIYIYIPDELSEESL